MPYLGMLNQICQSRFRCTPRRIAADGRTTVYGLLFAGTLFALLFRVSLRESKYGREQMVQARASVILTLLLAELAGVSALVGSRGTFRGIAC